MISFLTPFPFLLLMAYSMLLILQFSIDSLELLWVVIELLTFLLIGLVFISASSSTIIFGSVVYFITQSILSIVFLSIVFFIRFSTTVNPIFAFLFFFVIYINIGGFPFHAWYYSAVYSFPSLLFVLVLTLHNTPLLISFTLSFYILSNIALQQLLLLFIAFNLICIGVFSLMSSDIRSLLLSTSLANNSWLLMSCFSNSFTIIVYVIIYFSIVSMTMFGNYSVSCWSLITLSGLPPLPIFFIKLVIFTGVISNISFMSSLLFCSLFMLFTLLVSFSYLRFVFSSVLLNSFLGSILCLKSLIVTQ